MYSGLVGITAGAHRLWTHKSYKAKWPMRVILMICQTIAFQVSLFIVLPFTRINIRDNREKLDIIINNSDYEEQYYLKK